MKVIPFSSWFFKHQNSKNNWWYDHTDTHSQVNSSVIIWKKTKRKEVSQVAPILKQMLQATSWVALVNNSCWTWLLACLLCLYICTSNSNGLVKGQYLSRAGGHEGIRARLWRALLLLIHATARHGQLAMNLGSGRPSAAPRWLPVTTRPGSSSQVILVSVVTVFNHFLHRITFQK